MVKATTLTPKLDRWKPPVGVPKALTEWSKANTVYPSLREQVELAERFGTTRKRVRVWFQNQRQRKKLVATSHEQPEDGALLLDAGILALFWEELGCASDALASAWAHLRPKTPEERLPEVVNASLYLVGKVMVEVGVEFGAAQTVVLDAAYTVAAAVPTP